MPELIGFGVLVAAEGVGVRYRAGIGEMDVLQPVGRVVDVRRWIGARVDRAGAVAVGPERDAPVVGVGDGGRAGEGIRPR